MPSRAIRTLMDGLIDYAGLFPPAKLAMRPAVENYARYFSGPNAWMLGRFICTVSRLEEFRRETRDLLPTGQDDQPWRISAIIDGDLDENIDSIFAFNREHAEPDKGLAVADAIELRAAEPTFIDEALDLIPEELFPHFEIPVGGDFRGFVAAIAGNSAAAKIRTGGVTPDAFPSCKRVAAFLVACAAADVPFKATAGLHHPIRAEHALTYEADAPKGLMHGFLNVFLTAAMIKDAHLDEDAAASLLDVREPSGFAFDNDGAGIGSRRISAAALARARESFALSYGSCSFEEPIQDLTSLSLL